MFSLFEADVPAGTEVTLVPKDTVVEVRVLFLLVVFVFSGVDVNGDFRYSDTTVKT